MSQTVSIDDYVRTRHVTRSRVLRWIREKDAPCVSRGGHGPGQATLVDPDALDSWRGLDDGMRLFILNQVAEGLLDALLREGPEGVPVHRSIGISRKQAAAMLAFSFERAACRVLGRDLKDLPQPIIQIRTIVQTAR